jgi:hypothetical protein
MMETLDFELALLPELVDGETERMIAQSYYWDDFEKIAPIYGLDLNAYALPEQSYETHVLERAKQTLNKAQYTTFKRVWCALDEDEQIALIDYALNHRRGGHGK